MDHDAIIARITDLDDAEISAADRTALESHLSGCVSCRGSLEAWRAARRAFFSPPAKPTRQETELFVRAVMARVEAPARGFDWKAALVPAFGLAFAATAVAMALPRSVDPAEALIEQNQGLYAWASQPAPQSSDELLTFATEGR